MTTFKGPLGNEMTLDDLPHPDTSRWTIRRKAEVIAAITSKATTIEAMCERYNLSIEELGNWQRLSSRHGLQGLRVTRAQDYGDRSVKVSTR